MSNKRQINEMTIQDIDRIYNYIKLKKFKGSNYIDNLHEELVSVEKKTRIITFTNKSQINNQVFPIWTDQRWIQPLDMNEYQRLIDDKLTYT
jgi:hypothetical protein